MTVYEQRAVMAPRGLIASPHALATATGLRILQDGGNAIEAAVAAAAVIAVVYPHMNGIGGDNFWLIYNARQKTVHALLAAGRAGRRCTPEFMRAAGANGIIPRRGPLAACTVPGAIDGWWEAYQYSKQHLSGTWSFSSLLADAIYYAEAGFPVTPSQEEWTRRNIGAESGPFGSLDQFDEFRKVFLKPDGCVYQRGEPFVQLDLARTLRLIAEGGREVFYEGPVATAICRALAEAGGLLEPEDFASYRSVWADPIAVSYREWVVYNTPPPTQGVTSLQILNILENYPIRQIGDRSPDYYHVMIEATKRAFSDREHLADPDFVEVPVREFLSKSWAAEQVRTIYMDQAADCWNLSTFGGDTVWLGVVDAEGNAVSFIQSLYFDFGSGIVAGDTGVLLQNRGSSFFLDPGHPNVVEPGKRPFHTLNPAMALREDQVELVYGTMGGEGQPQTQAALVTRILDLKMDVQAAIDAPRWLYGRTWGETTSAVFVESRLSEDIVRELTRRGHWVQTVGPWDDRMGHAQAIWIDPRTKTRYGGADPRGDGIAAGY